MAITRRELICRSVCAAVGTTSIVRTIFDLGNVAAAATLPRWSGAKTASDYKALVCVFLYGGNDGNNFLVPRTGTDYTQYAAARGILALPAASLLPITPLTPDGRTYGLHGSTPGIQTLFGSGKLALLANVGPLVAPLNRTQFLNHSVAAPPQLFSHSDQQTQWQTSIADQPPKTGWGGRTADLLNSLNNNNQVSMSISLAGANVLQVGNVVTQFQVSSGGVIGLSGFTDGPNGDPVSKAIRSILGQPQPNLLVSATSGIVTRALDNNQILQGALAQAPVLTTVFPTSSLGKQLAMVAKLISAHTQLGLQRQVFFCSADGFDTHGDQINAQANLLSDVSASLSAFYNATVELGLANDVTTFTASDFGRTLMSNGSGSDHGWGNHQMILGGAVRGGDIYGKVPTLSEGGPDDSGSQGRWIPTTSVDEYSATLARWFGVTSTDMATVFPNLGRFNNPNLGFMAP
jgi:uncharacterized protein (DUF1501 family)